MAKKITPPFIPSVVSLAPASVSDICVTFLSRLHVEVDLLQTSQF